MKNIVDAHCLIWYLENNSRLGPHARAILQDPASDLVLPATAYAEACWIVQRGKTSIPTVAEVVSTVNDDSRIVVYPLDQEVIDASHNLTVINEMHDRQIVATALVLARQGSVVALLTHDGNITQARLVPVIW